MIPPTEHQKPLKSRFNDPNHPANSGSLISLLSGGHIAVPGVDEIVGMSQRIAVNAIQGKKITENDKPLLIGPALFKKLVTKDVLYLMIVNMPTQEEVQESVAQLENAMLEARISEQSGTNTST